LTVRVVFGTLTLDIKDGSTKPLSETAIAARLGGFILLGHIITVSMYLPSPYCSVVALWSKY